jgi:hypothetical protein
MAERRAVVVGRGLAGLCASLYLKAKDTAMTRKRFALLLALVAIAPLISCYGSLASSLRMMSQRFCMSRPQHELATVKFHSTRCRPTEHPSKYSGV